MSTHNEFDQHFRDKTTLTGQTRQFRFGVRDLFTDLAIGARHADMPVTRWLLASAASAFSTQKDKDLVHQSWLQDYAEQAEWKLLQYGIDDNDQEARMLVLESIAAGKTNTLTGGLLTGADLDEFLKNEYPGYQGYAQSPAEA